MVHMLLLKRVGICVAWATTSRGLLLPRSLEGGGSQSSRRAKTVKESELLLVNRQETATSNRIFQPKSPKVKAEYKPRHSCSKAHVSLVPSNDAG